MKRILGQALSLAAIVCLFSVDASAEDAKAEARARFDRGIRLFDEGDFSVALAEFRRAYDIAPHPTVLYNVALAYAALGKAVEATDACETLLKDPRALGPDQLARARAMRNEQGARVAELVVTTSTPAHIEVDNVEVGMTPLTAPIRVASGIHILSAYATGFAPLRKQVTAAGKTRDNLSFTLAPLEGRLAHLAVNSRVPGADLVANGDVLAKTPLVAPLTLAPGKYHVELRRKGYVTATSDVVLGDGANGSVTLEPEEDPARPSSVNGAVELHATEEGATLFVDGKLRGSAAHLEVPAGPHHLRVERAGFFAFERDVAVDEGRTLPLEVRLHPTAETRAEYDSSTHTQRTAGWIALGGGAAVAAAGIVYVVINGSAISDAQSSYDHSVGEAAPAGRCDPRGAGPHEVCAAELDAASSTLKDAQTRNVIGLVVAGVGVAAAATGAVLLLTSGDPHRYDRTSAQAHPGFRIVPVGAPLPGGGFFGFSGLF